MTLQQVVFFTTIYRHKSYTAAARELGVSQSALSKQIMALEKELGAQLIVRNVRQMKLTSQGELMLPHALQMAEEYREILRCAARGKRHQETVRLGGVPVLNIYGVTEALVGFEALHPQCHIEIWETETSNILSGLSACTLDVGIGRFLLPMEQESGRLQIIPLIDDEQVLVTAPGLFPQRDGPMPLGELYGKTVVLQNSDPLLSAYHLQRVHAELPQTDVQMLNMKMDSLLQFILKKKWSTLVMNRVAQEAFSPRAQIIPLADPLRLTLCAILPKTGASESGRALARYLRETFLGQSRFQ